jgi:hypothetical protein
MQKYLIPILVLSVIFFQSCVEDDIKIPDETEPEFRILNTVSEIEIDGSHQLELLYLNNFGMTVQANASWESSDTQVAVISESGLLMGKGEGTAKITGMAVVEILNSTTRKDTTLTTEFNITIKKEVLPPPPMEDKSREVSIATTSSYRLKGKALLKETDSGLILEFDDSYDADTNLPGLYVYLTNNPSTNSGALEVAKVTTFKGKHSYTIPGNPSINKYSHVLYYCKPFSVKVGDGKLEE